MMTKDNRRYYLDLKENSRGRFLRVSFKIYVYHLHIELLSNPTTSTVKRKPQYPESFCLLFILGFQVSQTIARGGPRSQIAIPAQGMIEFRDALTDLLEEFGTDDGGFKGCCSILLSFSFFIWFHHVFFVSLPMTGELPEGRHLRVENKNFYFDIGQNNRGIYMRISEVKIDYLFSIIILPKAIFFF
jgi:hypothetical protein